jgi:hypothetical protein
MEVVGSNPTRSISSILGKYSISLSPLSNVSSVFCSSMNLVAMSKCSTSLQVSQNLALENIEVTIVQALSRSNVMIEEMKIIIMNLPLLMMIAYLLSLWSPSDWSNLLKQTKTARLATRIASPS